MIISGPAGDLELRIDCPREGVTQRGAGVICHPHPQFGGTLHNKVAHTLAKVFAELGLAAVRFNFRGVGRSAGAYDNGRGETADLQAVIGWVQDRNADGELWLAGFSFGGYVALRAAADQPIQQLITIAPPVNRFAVDVVTAPRCPWLLIQGENDEIVPSDAVLSWAKGLPDPPAIEVVPDGDHLFHGRLNVLREILLRRLPAA
jgi:alpha/beta superfamily hydrolase